MADYTQHDAAVMGIVETATETVRQLTHALRTLADEAEIAASFLPADRAHRLRTQIQITRAAATPCPPPPVEPPVRCPWHIGESRCVETTDQHAWHRDAEGRVWRDGFQREEWPDAPAPRQPHPTSTWDRC